MRAMLVAASVVVAPIAAAGADCPPDVGLIETTAAEPAAFALEIVDTPETRARGLMFRTDIPEDGGMIFHPYPAEGGPPREASFWMKNTPTSLDIIFIREDRTIARIAENTVPFDETNVRSYEPVAAVLELKAGKAAEHGIAVGDKVSWEGL
ncbi:MAG: DUF192 domain-containing protein [Rubrimonas sp.]